MKTILIFLIITLSSFSFGQTVILPLNTPYDNIVHDSYLKDTQNQLNPFVGTWVYNQGGKKVTLKIQKIIYYYNMGSPPHYYEDILHANYKVEQGGNLVYSDMDTPVLYADIFGLSLKNGYYKMSYTDIPNCEIWTNLKIKKDPSNANKLIWEMEESNAVVGLEDPESDCPQAFTNPNFGDPMTLPYQMVLTKQSISTGP